MSNLFRVFAFLFLLISIQSYSVEAGFPFAEQHKLISNDLAAADGFGSTVITHENTAIVSADEAVYVFEYIDHAWSQSQKITPNDNQQNDYFGTSIALDDTLLIVGAIGVGQDPTSHLGAVYVYEKNELGLWSQVQKLMATDGDAYDRLGSSVVIHQGNILAGATNDDDNGSNSGAVYFFSKDVFGNWHQSQKMTPNDNIQSDFFGNALAISENTLLVGAYGAKANTGTWTGAAYIFKWNGSSWVESQKITADDGSTDDQFGTKLWIDGDQAIISALFDDDGGNNTGSVYIFSRTNEIWSKQQKLTASDGDIGDRFGSDVCIHGDISIIGANSVDLNTNGVTDFNAGAAYIFVKHNGTWVEQRKMIASDNERWDEYGSSVSLYSNQAIVGAPTNFMSATRLGGAYIYDVDASPPHQDTPGVLSGSFTLTMQYNTQGSGLILATDVDGLTDGDYFSITTPAQHGLATIDSSSGNWTYNPSNDYVGSDSFTVTLTDDLEGTVVRVISITVTAPDSDGDGAFDHQDNCPNVSNADQANSDGDALGDSCDLDLDGDGTDNAFDAFPTDPTESTDSDFDTIGDNADNCMNTANFDQSDIDADALGDLCDLDMDGDGYANVFELRFGGDESDNTDGAVSLANAVDFSETAPTDSDLDGVPDDYESAVGGDTTSATFQSVLDSLTINKQVPAIGSIGLLVLGMSMLGLGAVRLGKKQ